MEDFDVTRMIDIRNLWMFAGINPEQYDSMKAQEKYLWLNLLGRIDELEDDKNSSKGFENMIKTHPNVDMNQLR